MAKPKIHKDSVASTTVSRSEAHRSRVPEMGPHTTQPTAEFVQRFMDHVRKTGEPETFKTIDLSRPPEWSEPFALTRFSVDRNKRPNKDMAPCAICSPDNQKCLHRMFLMWYGREGLVRLVGPDCGDNIGNGEMYANARKEYNARRERERLEAFIESNLSKVPAMLAVLHALRPATEEAERLYIRLRSENEDIPKRLREIWNREQGLLTVNVRVKHEVEEDENGKRTVTRVGPAGFGDYMPQEFGTIVGAAMVRSKFSALADLDAFITIASAMPQMMDTEASFLWMCDESPETLERVRLQLRKLEAGHARLLKTLVEVREFFSPSFLFRLNAWGQHEDNQFDLAVEMEGGIYRFRHAGRTARLAPKMHLLSVESKWPELEDATDDVGDGTE